MTLAPYDNEAVMDEGGPPLFAHRRYDYRSTSGTVQTRADIGNMANIHLPTPPPVSPLDANSLNFEAEEGYEPSAILSDTSLLAHSATPALERASIDLLAHSAAPALERASLDLLAFQQQADQRPSVLRNQRSSSLYYDYPANNHLTGDLLNVPHRSDDPFNPSFYGIGSQFGSPAHGDPEACPLLHTTPPSSSTSLARFFTFLLRFALACIALGVGSTRLGDLPPTTTRLGVLCFTLVVAVCTGYVQARAERRIEELADAMLLILITGMLLAFLV